VQRFVNAAVYASTDDDVVDTFVLSSVSFFMDTQRVLRVVA